MALAELGGHPVGIAGRRRLQRGEALGAEVRVAAQRDEDGAHRVTGFEPELRHAVVVHPRQLQDVVRASGLGPRPDDGALPATERLAAHDGAGGDAVDVGIAHLGPLRPVRTVARVERPDAAREPVGQRVLDRQRVGEVAGGHEAEDGPEALRVGEPVVGTDAVDDPR